MKIQTHAPQLRSVQQAPAPQPGYIAQSKTEARSFWGPIGKKIAGAARSVASAPQDLRRGIDQAAHSARNATEHAVSNFKKTAFSLFGQAADHAGKVAIGAAAIAGDGIAHGAKAVVHEVERELHAGDHAIRNAALAVKPQVLAATHAVGHAAHAVKSEAQREAHAVGSAVGSAVHAVKTEAQREAHAVGRAADRPVKIAVGTAVIAGEAAAQKMDRLRQMMDASLEPLPASAKHELQHVAHQLSAGTHDVLSRVELAGQRVHDESIAAGNAVAEGVNTSVDQLKSTAQKLGGAVGQTAQQLRGELEHFDRIAYDRGDEVVREYQARHRPGLHNSILQLESQSQQLQGWAE